jgi:hypothetical protein
VALFLAALITLTGCPTSVDDDDSSGTVYAHRIYGGDVDPYQAQQAIDNAVAAGEAIVLEHNLIIQNGELNFKNADVRVNGLVTILNGVINVADARVSWAPGAKIEMIQSAYILHRSQKDDAAGKVPDGAMVEFVERVQDIMSTSTMAAVRNFKLGPKQNHDYSQDSDGIDARVTNPNLQVLFVVDKLTLPSEGSPLGDAGLPGFGLNIMPLGTMDVTGTIPIEVWHSGFRLGTCSTLTSSRGATITMGDWDPMEIPNVRVEEGKGITLLQPSPTPLVIGGKLTGLGPLTVMATDITVNGGDGNLIVSEAPQGGRRLVIYSTGKAVFTHDVDIAKKSKILSDLVFKGDEINVGESLDLLGNVLLENGQDINIAAGKTLTLGKDKIITLQIEPTKSTKVITAPLLTAVGGDVALSTSDNNTITLSTPASPKDDPEDIAEAKAILVRGTGPDLDHRLLGIVKGTLQVLPEAILNVNGTGATTVELYTNINGSAGEFGYLAVAEGGTFDLDAGNRFTIGYDRNYPYTELIEGGNFTFTASGGTIKLGNHEIAGSTPGTKLSPAKGTNGNIRVRDNGTLVLNSIEQVLSSFSGIAIQAGSKVTLDKGAKITLNAGENGQPTEWSNITVSTVNVAQVTGASVCLTPDPAAAKQPVWSVAHRGGELAQVNITATAGTVSLAKSGATFTR